MANAAAIAAAFGGGLPPGISGTNDRCTVLVSNLNPDVSAPFSWVYTPSSSYDFNVTCFALFSSEDR